MAPETLDRFWADGRRQPCSGRWSQFRIVKLLRQHFQRAAFDSVLKIRQAPGPGRRTVKNTIASFRRPSKMRSVSWPQMSS